MENIVVIVLDSFRKDRAGVYEEEVGFTENLDNFAEDATVYENAVANSSWTLPVHASIFTGLYPWEHGATQKKLELDVDEDTVAEELSERGYSTGCFTTNAWISGHANMVEGFDVANDFGLSSDAMDTIGSRIAGYVESNDNLLTRTATRIGDWFWSNVMDHKDAEEILDRGKSFIEDTDDFFLFMNLMDVHEPLRPPERYLEKHGAENSASEICQDPSKFYRGGDVDFEEVKRHYDAAADFLDDQLGEFFDWMVSEELMEETTVVVLSDHGQLLGEHGHYGHQYSVADELVEVPLLVKRPEGGGEQVDDLVELRELYNLIMQTAKGKDFTPDNDVVRGLYEFPEMMSNRIPKDRWNELFRRHRYAKSADSRLTVTETEEGEVERNWQGEEREELEEAVDSIGGSESGSSMEEKEEEIKEQLEALGYG